MNDPTSCFSETLDEPVKIINVLDVNSQSARQICSHDIRNEQQLQNALSEFTGRRENGCQIM
jgi:hypothetical protein